jgi:hypothetical protein
MPLNIGQVIHNNRYRIDGLLGRGGMGAIYKAWDTTLSVPVAIKENLDASPEAQKQFSREANLLARLSHPNLPRVTDYFFIPEQGQYLVMDFVEGEDLGAMLQRRGRLPEPQVLTWISQICEALSYLHSQPNPVIHRDIKPSNIKIRPDGRAMLVDFGIAKIYDPHLATTIGAKAVTPGFSPPEQYGGGRTDTRSDIYALGATIYTLLTGQAPPESVSRMVSQQPLPPPREVNPAISLVVEQAILKSVEIATDRRFQTVDELKAALTGSVAGPKETVHFQPVPPTQKMAMDEAQLRRGAPPSPRRPAVARAPAAQAPRRGGLPPWVLILGGGALLVVLAAIVIIGIYQFAPLLGKASATPLAAIPVATQTATSLPTTGIKPSPVTAIPELATSTPTLVEIKEPTLTPTLVPFLPTPTPTPALPAPKDYQTIAEIVGPSGQSLRGVAEKDGYVFVLANSGGFWVYDLTKLSAGMPFASFTDPVNKMEVKNGGGLLRYGDWLYAFGYSGIEALNIQDPTNPAPAGNADGFQAMSLALYNDLLIAPSISGVGIFSLKDPGNPQMISFTKYSPAWADSAGKTIYVFSAAVYNSVLYTSEFVMGNPGEVGLRAFDISDPANPKELGLTPQKSDVAYYLFVVDERLVACASSTVELYYMGNPAALDLQDSQKADSRVCALDRGNLLTNGLGFRILAGKAFEVFSKYDTRGGVQTDGFPYGSAVAGNFVYLAQSTRILVLVGAP